MYSFIGLEYTVGPHDFRQILDTVKNRLLEFVLKLGDKWHVDSLRPSSDELSRLVSVVIYNSAQGGNVSIFDQRGQHVNYQYNAAGNININAVQDKKALIDQLGKLREEVERAKELQAIDKDTAIEAEYHLQQANKEAREGRPNKGSFLGHIGKAKDALKDVAAAANLITALIKVAEVADKIIPSS